MSNLHIAAICVAQTTTIKCNVFLFVKLKNKLSQSGCDQ